MAVVRFILPILLAAGSALADDSRAHVNYMLHCQGCHLPQAEGFAGKVPRIKDFAGYFLHSAEGREFLIRVPGVAQSALRDAEVAELMNWLLESFSVEQAPATFVRFTESEVAALRKYPIGDPATERDKILRNLAADIPDLAVNPANNP